MPLQDGDVVQPEDLQDASRCVEMGMNGNEKSWKHGLIRLAGYGDGPELISSITYCWVAICCFS